MERKREKYVALGGLTGPAIAVAMLEKGDSPQTVVLNDLLVEMRCAMQ